EERADLLTIYDDHGGYGHPDHIQVHRLGRRAAELAGVDRVFESTMNRDALRRMIAEMPQLEEAFDEEELREVEVGDDFGSPEELITHAVDVGAVVDRKRAAMVAHASQIPADSFFLKM